MANTLSWWDLYKQDLSDEFKKLAQFGKQAAAAAGNVDTHWQNLLGLWNRAKSDWDAFIEGRDLDEIRVHGRKLSNLVIILGDAEEILEQFRLDRLKETIQAKYQTILDAINEMKTGPADFASTGTSEDVGPVTVLMNRVDDFLDQVERILEALLSIVELFDVITTTEKEMEKKALPQGNPRNKIEDDGFHFSRRV